MQPTPPPYTQEEYREYQRIKRETRDANWHLVQRMSAELYFDVHEFTDVHQRLSKPGCATIDVWLSTGKVWPVGSAERGFVPDSLELFLRDNYEKPFEI